jgi:hypothetical protein
MCWGLQIDIPTNGRADGIADALAFNGRIATAGRPVPVLTGADGNRQWLTTTFGIGVHSQGAFKRFWNARKDALHTAHCWTPLLGQHAVIPITAYVDHSPEETWHLGERAWVPCLMRQGEGGGIAVITNDNQSPILATQDDAIAWLNTKSWNVMQALSAMTPVDFVEADIFMHARLKADARSRVPIKRNVHAA